MLRPPAGDGGEDVPVHPADGGDEIGSGAQAPAHVQRDPGQVEGSECVDERHVVGGRRQLLAQPYDTFRDPHALGRARIGVCA